MRDPRLAVLDSALDAEHNPDAHANAAYLDALVCGRTGPEHEPEPPKV